MHKYNYIDSAHINFLCNSKNLTMTLLYKLESYNQATMYRIMYCACVQLY